jgi:hypothetical protein
VIESGTIKTVILKFAPTLQTISQVPINDVDVWVESMLRCVVKDPYSNVMNEYLINVRGQVSTMIDNSM